jgi:hypothetical protein
MMDEQIIRDNQPKPGASRPLGEIVIIKEPNPKPLIEPADLGVDGSFHQQAKSSTERRSKSGRRPCWCSCLTLTTQKTKKN